MNIINVDYPSFILNTNYPYNVVYSESEMEEYELMYKRDVKIESIIGEITNFNKVNWKHIIVGEFTSLPNISENQILFLYRHIPCRGYLFNKS